VSDERGAFAYEVVLLGELEGADPQNELLDRAVAAARGMFALVEDPAGEPAPLLIVERGGELNGVLWSVISDEFREQFIERVVPGTVDALDPDRLALVSTAFLPVGKEGGSGTEVVLVCAMDRRADGQPGLTLAARVARRATEPPALGDFAVLYHGLSADIGRALFGGEAG
jgi:hypothetical protein